MLKYLPMPERCPYFKAGNVAQGIYPEGLCTSLSKELSVEKGIPRRHPACLLKEYTTRYCEILSGMEEHLAPNHRLVLTGTKGETFSVPRRV
jgi:hypothetical protein